MRNAPCMCCKNKNIGCHSQCNVYKVWKKQNDDAREKMRNCKANDWQINSFLAGHNNRSQNLARERGRMQ